MRTNRALAAAALVLGALAVIAGDTPAPGGAGAIDALDLAEAIRDDPAAVIVLDARDEAAFEEFHVPRARRLDVGPDAAPARVVELGGTPESRIVVTGGPQADPRPAWLALRRAGFADAYYVRDVVGAWVDRIISPVLSPDASDAERHAWERQADLSRYFGGFPRIAERDEEEGAAARLRRARRRGCAF